MLRIENMNFDGVKMIFKNSILNWQLKNQKTSFIQLLIFILTLSFLIKSEAQSQNEAPPSERAAPLKIKADTTPTTEPAPIADNTQSTSSSDSNEKKRLKRILAVIEISVDDQPYGIIKAQLFPDKAPQTVENFMELTEGKKPFKEYDEKKGTIGANVSRPFYDGLRFHRIVKDYVIQGGCPLGTGRGGPGFTIKDEFSKELRHSGPGFLAMSNSGKPNTGGSQFYITLKELKHLDGKNAIFGKVVEGMEVLNKLANLKVDRMIQKPIQDVRMKSVKIVREYVP